ncbi:sensor histidine kinase [Sphingomonas faeni]|uniref:sensor histidine kinase n=1 Tax=Sphingomonas faeni TaxID=185950 RepID=UPI002782F9E1|nr:sensor histidine kinase [Sphingomonas faeni]MDQ0840022.1 two-component sensor histidine kinase [Sphingomonas faeni]
MAQPLSTTAPAHSQSASHDDLLLRETHHRCSNDLQLVVGLLSLQSRRATNPETRDALADAMGRVAVLARARIALNQRRELSLQGALRQVCEALHSQAEPRSILISLQTEHDEVKGLAPDHISTLALVVNELATNAIKHAFEEGKSGHVSISVRRDGERQAVIIVDDDGLPFPEADNSKNGGMGLGLIKRLVASADSVFIHPTDGSKRFEIRVPVQPVPPRT